MRMGVFSRFRALVQSVAFSWIAFVGGSIGSVFLVWLIRPTRENRLIHQIAFAVLITLFFIGAINLTYCYKNKRKPNENAASRGRDE